MPKRGGPGGNRIWSSRGNRQNDNYNHHVSEISNKLQSLDTFGPRSGRRVSFKPIGPTGKKNFKGNVAERAIRSQLEADEDMDGRKSYYNPLRPRRRERAGSPIPRGGQGPRGKKKLIAGASGWFQVTIPHGQKYEKSFILKALLEVVAPRTFVAYLFKTEPTCVSFYVDDINIAEDILNADRTIHMPDGFKMVIKVRNSIPVIQIGPQVKEKMKMAMVKRYNAQTKALDLTNFHADVDLRDTFCALFRPTVMLAAIEIISENIPDLEALNLNDNRLHLMDHLKCLALKVPHLKILYLAKNKITTTIALDGLKELELVELVLNDNPLKSRMDESVYVREIRRKFPKLQKLDGQILPPQIGFDIADSSNAPAPVASFLCDMAGTDIVRQFLEQYFIIYDSDNRQPLLDAYHEQAMFSLTATYHSQPSNRLTPYLTHTRNLMRLRDSNVRTKHLKNGRLPVVSLLSELPATQHDPQSFAVDLSLFTPQFMLLTVTGVFKEKPNNLIRSFQRVLLIVPSGSGFCIKNEMMHVNNPTMHQLKVAFKTPTPAPAPITQPTVSQEAHSSTTPDDATKMQMIQSMAQHSNMNLEWSKKCLEETNWNFERAGYVFTELHKQNKIPPEAFVKQ